MLTTGSETVERISAMHGSLQRDQLLRAFRLMVLSRRLDDREILLKRQNKIYFQISGAGHEAAQIAAGLSLRPGYDWFYPYYRDRALCLTLGVTPEDMLLQAVGAAADKASGGRQMPSHWSNPDLHIVTGSSPTGTQFTQALGCAHASLYLDRTADDVTLVCTGDGATSEGEFWETMNIACLERLPLLVLVEDNGFAISVPVEHQTAGGNISRLLRSFPNLLVEEADGTDLLEGFTAMEKGVEWCRARRGPAVVHLHVTRPYSHSLSDDERLYKSASERAFEAERDCLLRYSDWLISEGVCDRQTLQDVMEEVNGLLQPITDKVLGAEPPAAGESYRFLYSDKVDPTGREWEIEPAFRGEPRTMVDAINLTIAEEMRRDDRVLVFGQDVADCSREENLQEVKGKGGVFKTTAGLQIQFGMRRCFNTSIAEAAIVGRSIGLATRGLKPVAEIQFFDYIWPAMMQIRDEMATIRWRSFNGWSCPAVLRVPIGGYLTGGAIYHSQCGESIFTHIPGIRVVMPSNALDACGLLRTAIRSDDPVLFLEHKRLYREPYNRSPHPGPDFTIPFGKARTVKQGDRLTIVTYGYLVQRSLEAARQLETRWGADCVEILDLRTLSPYDWPAVEASVKRTSRVLVAHEDCLSWGYGAEIGARIASELFPYLDSPVGRVGALDTWVAYNPRLEDEILPQVADIVKEAERLLSF